MTPASILWDRASANGQPESPGSPARNHPGEAEVRAFFPQLEILSRADVFLSHTGMNSTMEALYFGVLVVAFPLQPEQEANARRVEELGLGRRLSAEELSPALIRTLVTEVRDDQGIRRNLDVMKQRVRGAGRAIGAADAIEHYLGVTPSRRGEPGSGNSTRSLGE